MDDKKSHEHKAITGAQIRAARALIGWSAYDLAGKASLGVSTIRRAERPDRPMAMTVSNLAAVRRALRAAGIDFTFDAEGGSGVSLRKKKA
jgi:hypothetical protein